MRYSLVFLLFFLCPSSVLGVIVGANEMSGGNTLCDTTLSEASSFTVGANDLVVACITTEVTSGTAVVPTLSGKSITFTQIATRLSSDNLVRVTMLAGSSPTPTAGGIIVGISANQDNCTFSVASFSGQDVVTPIRQTNGADSVIGATGLFVPFSTGFGDATNNAVYACFGHNTTNALTIAAPMTQFAGSSGCCNSRTAHGWKVGQETGATVAGSGSPSVHLHLGIVAEVNVGVTAAGTHRRIAPQHQSLLFDFFFTPLRGGYVVG